LYFPRKNPDQEWIQGHQIAIIKQPGEQRKTLLLKKEKKLTKPRGKDCDHIQSFVPNTDTCLITQERIDASMDEVYSCDKIYKDLTSPTMQQPTMDKCNTLQFCLITHRNLLLLDMKYIMQNMSTMI